MIVAGLTGSIAMGKSAVGAMFASVGVPVFDADTAVSELYEGTGAIEVEAIFPGVTSEGRVDRNRLAQRVLRDNIALKRLESLVHPAVARLRGKFLERAAGGGHRLTIVEVPLLFETGGEASVDLVLVVSTTESIQRSRALARVGMADAKLEAILLRQMPDFEKRRKAHFVIDTSGSWERTQAQVLQFMRAAGAIVGHNNRHA
jgi:dephospho-CoA kinase